MSDEKPDDFAAKAEKLSDDALKAGIKFVETSTGKKVADATDAAFATASDLGQKIADSDLGKKALASDLGKQAADLVQQASDKTKATIPNTLARNIAIGAAAGAVIALPLPIVGPIFGALVGGGLGYLRTITKKR
jgi:phosphosulfolactate synthase (CoM biosynthesis protein A)